MKANSLTKAIKKFDIENEIFCLRYGIIYSDDYCVDYKECGVDQYILSKIKNKDISSESISAVNDLIGSFEVPEDGMSCWESSVFTEIKNIPLYEEFLEKYKDKDTLNQTKAILRDIIAIKKNIISIVEILKVYLISADGKPLSENMEVFIMKYKPKMGSSAFRKAIINSFHIDAPKDNYADLSGLNISLNIMVTYNDKNESCSVTRDRIYADKNNLKNNRISDLLAEKEELQKKIVKIEAEVAKL